MSRFRANTSASPVDREIQGYVAAAERAVRAAMDACGRARREDDGGARLVPVRRDLERALGSLQGVRRANPRSAPDFQPTERALHEAVGLCAGRLSEGDPYARVARDLARALDSLRGIRGARPVEDQNQTRPDLPETEESVAEAPEPPEVFMTDGDS